MNTYQSQAIEGVGAHLLLKKGGVIIASLDELNKLYISSIYIVTHAADQ